MPEREFYNLKLASGGTVLWKEAYRGAHYYAASPILSTNTYTKASANIVLPPVLPDGRPGVKNVPSPNVGAQYAKRNAYISLGICNRNNSEGVDLGIVNVGNGWMPVSFDTTNRRYQRYSDYKAPSDATNAVIAVKPISRSQVKLYVQFTDSRGNFVGKTFNEPINVNVRRNDWGKYYRFASLVQDPEECPDLLNDETYMINGGFTDLKLFKSNNTTEAWGLDTGKIQDAWIASHPKCQVLTQGDSYETFSIIHWA